MDKDLIAVLGSVGFTDKEARVYIALLSLGTGNVHQIATLSELKRPIIYVVLESLIKRGYASAVPGKKIQTFQAIEPANVLRKLQSDISNFTQYLPIFKTLGNRGESRPKISYIDTKEGILHIYEEINYDPAPLFITSYSRIEAHFPGIVSKWVRGFKKGTYKKISARHIAPDTKEELSYIKDFTDIHHKVRVASFLREAKMDISIYSNKLAISNLGGNLFVVVIESQDLVDSLRPIFEVVWQSSKEIT